MRRSTGGGAVYHDLGNLNYSFITDAGDTDKLTMERFTAPIVHALRQLGLNAEASGRNDILVEGKKVSGTAQRLLGGRILHHGTVLFDSNPDMVSGALNADPVLFENGHGIAGFLGTPEDHAGRGRCADGYAHTGGTGGSQGTGADQVRHLGVEFRTFPQI